MARGSKDSGLPLGLDGEAERPDQLFPTETNKFNASLAQFGPVGACRHTLDDVMGSKQRDVAEATGVLGHIRREEPDGGVLVRLAEGQRGDPADLARITIRVHRRLVPGGAAHRGPLPARRGPEHDEQQWTWLIALPALPQV